MGSYRSWEKIYPYYVEIDLLPVRSSSCRLGYAVLLKHLQVEGRFPERQSSIPQLVICYIADQLSLEADDFKQFLWNGRDHVPFPSSFREVLGMHIQKMHKQRAIYLFNRTKENQIYKRKVLTLNQNPTNKNKGINNYFLVSYSAEKRGEILDLVTV